MYHPESFVELQRIVGKYVTRYDLLVAAGPVTAATLIRTFITDNKLVKFAVVGTGIWFAVREISGPLLWMMMDQFNTLRQILSNFSG